MSDVIAVVLAAGSGQRYRESGGAGPKLLAEVGGRPLVVHVVEAAVGAGLGDVVVVQGAADLVEVLADAGLLDSVTLIENEDWDSGLASSLRCAVDHADRVGAAAVVVGLADQPRVDASCWAAVAGGEAPISVATYDGVRRNPVRLAREVWPLLPVDGDVGARVLLSTRPDLVGEIPCAGDPTDVDTLADLDRVDR